MDKELSILKQTIDAALKAGIFQNMESANAVILAFQKIAQAVTPPKQPAQ